MRKIKNIKLYLILISLILSYYLFIKVTTPKTMEFYKEFKSDTLEFSNFSENNLNILMDILEIQHPEVVINQARLETGNYTSNKFKRNNNLFGFRNSKGYYKYDNWKESVIHYAHWQNINYKGGNYYQFLIDIHYAEDSLYIKKLKQFK